MRAVEASYAGEKSQLGNVGHLPVNATSNDDIMDHGPLHFLQIFFFSDENGAVNRLDFLSGGTNWYS
jgi:hypothetical protein